MGTDEHRNTKNSGRATILGLIAAIGAFALPACQAPSADERQSAGYGNPRQADPYNPFYGNPAPGNTAWVEDISGQDAFNPPPPQQDGYRDYNPPPATSNPRTHVVRRGETLWRLSRTYGTTVAAIKSANGIPAHSDTIIEGSTIAIP